MNKKRLHKRTNAVIGGVCGGIAEYAGIDPTLVRILTVVIVVAGLGLPVVLYLVCLLIFPSDPSLVDGYVEARAQVTIPPCQRVYHTVSLAEEAAGASRANALGADASQANALKAEASQGTAQSAQSSWGWLPGADRSKTKTSEAKAESGLLTLAKSHWSLAPIVGAALVSIGAIALLCSLVHISLWRFWPLVLVAAGLVGLFTPSSHGWSLERAGNAIALIAVALALLAWMLRIIPARYFLFTFYELWPALLVVAGVSLIAMARKNSVLILASSLAFSALVIFGLWFTAGLDLSSLSSATIFGEVDAHDLIADFFLENGE